MSNTQEIGWNAVSKTGAVAAGGAGAVAAGIEILEQVETRQMQQREQFSHLTSQITVHALLAVRCRSLSMMQEKGK